MTNTEREDLIISLLQGLNKSLVEVIKLQKFIIGEINKTVKGGK